MKISKLVKIFKKIDFGPSDCRKLSILPICRFWTKLHLKVIYSQNFRIISTSVNICKYRGFGKKFRKFSILLNIHENLDIGQN